MSKYIDAEKLIAEIERRKNESRELAQEHKNSSLGNAAQTMANEDEEILSLIASLQQEQPEVDLDAIVNEAFDKYSSVDGYGQLSVSFNRAELYSFIKKIARKEE